MRRILLLPLVCSRLHRSFAREKTPPATPTTRQFISVLLLHLTLSLVLFIPGSSVLGSFTEGIQPNVCRAPCLSFVAYDSTKSLDFSNLRRGSQWGGGIYGYRLKFWLVYGYRLVFFSYG